MGKGLFERMNLTPAELDPERLKALAKKAAGEGGEYLEPDSPLENVDNSPAAVARRKKEMAGTEEWNTAVSAQKGNSEWIKGVGGRAERPMSLRKDS